MKIAGVRIDHWGKGSYPPSEDSLLLAQSLWKGGGRFLDVGTGTGIVAIKAATLGYDVTATDMDAKALSEASMNAAENGVGLGLVQCDLLECINCTFTLIAFNPPYLPEGGMPDSQLAGGPEGVELALKFMSQASEHLESWGEVLVVLSSLGNTALFIEECAMKWDVLPFAARKVEFETLTVYRARLRHPLKK